MRPVTPANFQPASAMATPIANRPSLIHSLCWPRSAKAMSASRTCSTTISVQFFAVLPLTVVVRPTIAQELMPVKAAR